MEDSQKQKARYTVDYLTAAYVMSGSATWMSYNDCCSLKASLLHDAGSEGTLSNPLYAEQIRPGKPISCYGEGRAGTKIRKIPMSQKKINYFAKLIRRMHVDDALAQCKLQPKKAGRILGEVHSCHTLVY